MCLNSVKEVRVLKRKTVVYGCYQKTNLNMTYIQRTHLNLGINKDNYHTVLQTQRYAFRIPSVPYKSGYHRFPNLKSAIRFREYYLPQWNSVIIKEHIPAGTKITVGTQRVGLKSNIYPTVYVTPTLFHTHKIVYQKGLKTC